MTGDAVFMNAFDKGSTKPRILMVVVATADNVVAAGDPKTLSADIADGLNESFKNMPAANRSKAIQDMIDGFRNNTRGQGNIIEVVPYVGPNKDRADAAIAEFTKQRSDKILKKR